MKKFFQLSFSALCLGLLFYSGSTVLADEEAIINLDKVIKYAENKIRKETLTDYYSLITSGKYDTTQIDDNLLDRMVTFKPGKTDLVYEDFQATPIGEQEISEEKMLYVGSSMLNNNSNEPATLTSQSFTYSTTNQITTTTNHTIGASITATSNFTVPFLGESGLSLSASYSYSDSQAKLNSTQTTYVVPSQNITVPAKSSVKVTAYLKKTKIKGDVLLKGKVKGDVSGVAIINGWNPNPNLYREKTFSISDAAHEMGYRVNDDNSINIEGTGSYEAIVGSDMIIIVENLSSEDKSIYELPSSTLSIG